MSITYLDAIREAQARALAEDPRVYINDRTHAFDRRAHGRTNDRIFADRRINHASGKLLREVFWWL